VNRVTSPVFSMGSLPLSLASEIRPHAIGQMASDNIRKYRRCWIACAYCRTMGISRYCVVWFRSARLTKLKPATLGREAELLLIRLLCPAKKVFVPFLRQLCLLSKYPQTFALIPCYWWDFQAMALLWPMLLLRASRHSTRRAIIA